MIDSSVGDYFGETGLLDGFHVRETNVQSITYTEFAVLSHISLKLVTNNFPDENQLFIEVSKLVVDQETAAEAGRGRYNLKDAVTEARFNQDWGTLSGAQGLDDGKILMCI